MTPGTEFEQEAPPEATLGGKTRTLLLAISLGLAIVGAYAYTYYTPKPAAPISTGVTALDAFVGQLPPGMRIEIASARADAQGVVTARNIAVTGPVLGRFHIGEMVLHDYDTANPVPAHVDMSLRGLALPFERLGGGARVVLNELGYDRVTIDVDYAYRYDAASRRFELGTLGLTMAGAGALSLAAGLSNVAALDSGAPALGRALISGGTITYSDQSLVARVLRRQAEAEGIGLAEYRERLFARLDAAIAGAERDQERALIAAVKTFIASPGDIVFTFAPPRPISPSEIMALPMNAAAIQRTLGLSATVK